MLTIVKCAWCIPHRELCRKRDGARDGIEITSHTICDDCRRKETERIEDLASIRRKCKEHEENLAAQRKGLQ